MAITERVRKQFFTAADSPTAIQRQLIRLPSTVVVQYEAQDATPAAVDHRQRRRQSGRRANLWSVAEHERFLEGLQQYPRGPWKSVAATVGTKTVRQTMTHAQKYRQKIERKTKRERELGGDAVRATSQMENRGIDGDDVPSLDELLAEYYDTSGNDALSLDPLASFCDLLEADAFELTVQDTSLEPPSRSQLVVL